MWEMTNEEIVSICEPFYPVLGRVFGLAWRNTMNSIAVLGIPTKVERANMMHAAIRTELRRLCDRLDPIVQLIEEPDGGGLDYVLLDSGREEKLALRWGRYGDGRIRRNPTERQLGIQGQGLLPFSEWSALDADAEPTVVAIGYTVENDYTEAGCPAWWMGRLVLLRERTTVSEFIHDIAAFKQHEVRIDHSVVAGTELRIVERERRAIERAADGLRRKHA